MSSPVPPSFPPSNAFPNPAPLPPGKKSNILLWVLGGIVVLMIGSLAMCTLGGYLLMRKAKQSGFDSALISKNPGYAAAKMVVTMNPDLDIVSSDDSNGTISVREKKTGKTMTMKFDPQKKSMVFTDENGKEATIRVNTDGDKGGAVEVQSSDGTVKFGATANNQMPAWIPTYPGSSPQGTFSSQTKDGNQATFAFKTSDAPPAVMSYYQDQLKAGGFNITMTTNTPQGGLVMAQDGGKTRSVMLTVSTSSDGTNVSVTSVEKK